MGSLEVTAPCGQAAGRDIVNHWYCPAAVAVLLPSVEEAALLAALRRCKPADQAVIRELVISLADVPSMPGARKESRA